MWSVFTNYRPYASRIISVFLACGSIGVICSEMSKAITTREGHLASGQEEEKKPPPQANTGPINQERAINSPIVTGNNAKIIYYLGPTKNDSPTEKLHPRLNLEVSFWPDHEEGTTIAGIAWRKEAFTDVRLKITNDSEVDLENVDLTVRMDTYIVDIGALKSVPTSWHKIPETKGLTPSNFQGFSMTTWDEKGNAKEDTDFMRPVAFPSFRLTFERLLRGQPIELVLAAADLFTEQNGHFVAASKFAIPKRRPTFVEISGKYDATTIDGKRPRFDIANRRFPLPE